MPAVGVGVDGQVDVVGDRLGERLGRRRGVVGVDADRGHEDPVRVRRRGDRAARLRGQPGHVDHGVPATVGHGVGHLLVAVPEQVGRAVGHRAGRAAAGAGDVRSARDGLGRDLAGEEPGTTEDEELHGLHSTGSAARATREVRCGRNRWTLLLSGLCQNCDNDPSVRV